MDAQLADICEQQHTPGSCSPREGSDFSMAFEILYNSLCSPSRPSHLLDLVPLSLPNLPNQPLIPSYLLTFAHVRKGFLSRPSELSLSSLPGPWDSAGAPSFSLLAAFLSVLICACEPLFQACLPWRQWGWDCACLISRAWHRAWQVVSAQ